MTRMIVGVMVLAFLAVSTIMCGPAKEPEPTPGSSDVNISIEQPAAPTEPAAADVTPAEPPSEEAAPAMPEPSPAPGSAPVEGSAPAASDQPAATPGA